MRPAAILVLVCSFLVLLSACTGPEREFPSGTGGSGGSAATSSGAGGAGSECADGCDDGDACSDDFCEVGICLHTPINLDDKDVCTIDACDGLKGPSHTPVDVADGDACTVDACDPVSGPTHTPEVIDDGNACTADACDALTGVSHDPIYEPTKFVISELHIGTPDYLVLSNTSKCPNSIDGFEVLFEDSVGADIVTPLPAQVIPPGGTLKISDAPNAPPPEVFAGGSIGFDPSTGGYALLCDGSCATAANIVDAVVFSIGAAPPPLPPSVTFTPGPLEGITSTSQQRASFHRVAFAGAAPGFLASNWRAGYPCDVHNLQIVELSIGSTDYAVIKNPTICPLSLAGLQVLFDDSNGIDHTFVFPAQMMAPGESVRLVQSGPVGTDINVGAIPFSTTRGGNTLLCDGVCTVGANVIDAIAYDGDMPHPALPMGATFLSSGVTGITAANQDTASFVRIQETGVAPAFKKTDWSTGPRCSSTTHLQLAELKVGTVDFVRLENSGFCGVSLSGLYMLFDDSLLADVSMQLPGLTLAAGARIYIKENAVAGEINVAQGIPFSSARGGAVLLCTGACSAASGSNVLDVVAFSTGAPHPALPTGIVFSPAGLTGINAASENVKSFRRANDSGSNPTFFASAWFVGSASK